jgi:N-acylneuraminate cytidylyltransferase
MNIVAMIPARGNSKSILGKNIMSFCGKPLIAWSIEQALASVLVNGVYVSTDDKKVADISKKYGARIIKRPAALATDTSSSEEALIHGLDEIEKKGKESVDIVVFLQATSPLRESTDIDNALQKFIDECPDSLFSGAVLEDFLIWGMVKGKFTSVNYDYKNRGLRQDRGKQYVENGSFYIFRPEILRREKNRLGGKVAVYEMEFWKSCEIDSYKDVEICQYYMRNKLLNKFQQSFVPEKGDVNID